MLGVDFSAHSQTIESMVALLVVATIVGIIAHRIRVPYTVSLMIVGIGMSWLQLVPKVELTQGLLVTVFLPALLFEAAIHFPLDELRKFGPTIAGLAVPGVICTAFATALVLHLELAAFGVRRPMGFIHALLFGAIIAATDPIAIIALFKQLGVKRRLSIILEGESLFNDGTSIVIYSVVLTALLSGTASVSDGITLFLTEALGGIAIGAILGIAASYVVPFAKDPLICIALTTVVAYGSYLAGDWLHASGVLATASAGLFLGNIGKKNNMEPLTRLSVVSFWRYAAFFISSLVFIMIGLKVDVPFLLNHLDVIMLAFLAVLASRAIAVILPWPIINRMGQPLNWRSAVAVWWGGLRGSLSMVLVLSLPDDMPQKDNLIAMTFGVVVLSVIIQGSTMGPVVRWLGLVDIRTEAMAFLGKSLARLRAISAQQKELTRLASEEGFQGSLAIHQKLVEEKNQILQTLKDRQNDPELMAASQSRAQIMEEHLKEVSWDSFRQSMQMALINEEELGDLTSQSAALSESASKQS